jgi:hypothetical protein
MPTVTFTLDLALTGKQVPIAYLEFNSKPAGGSVTPYYWSDKPVAASTAFLDPRVISFGSAVRSLSDWMGRYESASFDVTISDYDKLIAGMLEGATTKYLANREAILYLHEDSLRRSGYDPLTVMRGIVQLADPSGRQVHFVSADYVTAEFGDLTSSALLPRRQFDSTRFSTIPASTVGAPEPIIYGQMRGTAEASGGTHGLVYPVFTGYETIGGSSWGRFVVASHACKSIVNFWMANIVQNWYLSTGVVLAPGWDNPGGNDWETYFGTTAYREFSGRRYCVIYVQDGPIVNNHVNGSFPITLDVDGVEDVGNGTGTLITDPVLQYEHCVRNFLLGDYQYGSWLSTPVSPISGAALMDSSSWTTAAGQKGVTYVGAGCLGMEGERASISDWLERWNLSADVFLGFNKSGQLIVANDTLGSPTVTLTDNDILEGTFSTPPEWDRLANVIPYAYKRDPVQGIYEIANQALTNSTSITNYSGRRLASRRELWFVRDATTSQDIARQWLRRQKDLPRKVVFSAGIHVHSLVEIGDRIIVSHRDGPASNYSATVQVTRLSASLDNLTIAVEGYDLSAQEQNPSFSTETLNDASSSGSTPGAIAQQASVTTAAFSWSRFMGGSRSQGYRHTTDAPLWEWINQPLDWSLLGNATAQILVDVKTENAATTVYARIWNVTSGTWATAAQSSASTSWTTLTFSLTPPSPASAMVYQVRIWASQEDVHDVFGMSNPGLVVSPA